MTHVEKGPSTTPENRLFSQQRLLVFVPTFNDTELVASIVSEICAISSNLTVLVVDDGSTNPVDRTSLPDQCLLFRTPDNFGLGTATHIALDHMLKHGYDALVRVDADGQHPIDRLTDILRTLETAEVDLVVGGRANRNEGTAPRDLSARLVRGYLSVVARILTKNRAPADLNSGLFAVNARAAAVLNQTPLERFPEPEMYILACRRGLRVKEVSVEQGKRKHGESSVTIGHALRLLYRFNMFALSELIQGSKTQ